MKLDLEETPRSLVFKRWSLRTWTPNSADQCPIYLQFVAYMSTIRLTADISLFDVLGWRLGNGGKRMFLSKNNCRTVR